MVGGRLGKRAIDSGHPPSAAEVGDLPGDAGTAAPGPMNKTPKHTD